MADLAQLTGADFQPHLAEVFRVHAPSIEPIELELDQVAPLGPRTTAEAEAAGRRPPFALVFLGPASDQYLAQATYTVAHAQLGELTLFLVPLGPTAERRMRYEAVFT
ncbi:MAG TPA: hypothetical protein VJG32_07780 [Anaerolineae bacterium]|nr:hypothetical protein [Anaerolineae bacterium]